jgi:hypothetical protein
MTNLKHNHRFIYEVTESTVPDVIPHRVEMEVSGDADLSNMLAMFEQYLKGCGFVWHEGQKLQFTEE